MKECGRCGSLAHVSWKKKMGMMLCRSCLGEIRSGLQIGREAPPMRMKRCDGCAAETFVNRILCPRCGNNSFEVL